MSPSKSSLHSEEDEEFFDPHEVDANYSKNLSGTTSQINYPENFTNSSEVVLSSPDGVLSTSTTSEQIMKSPFHPKYTGQKKYSNNTPQNSNIVNLEPCVLREENPVVYNVTDVSLLENDGLVNQPIDKVENLLLAQISPLTLESSLEDLNIEKYKRSDYELDGISRACEPSENLLISGKTEALNSCSSYSTILNQSANEIDLKLANIRLDYSKDSMENHNVKNSKHINSILEDTELEKNEFSHELHNEVLVNKYIAPESLEAISHSSLEPSNVHTYDTNLEISQSLSNDCVVLPDSKTQPDFKTLNEIKSNKKTFKAIKITKPHEPLSKSEDLVIKSTVNSDDLLNSSMNNISSDLISKKNMTSELSSNDLNVPSESSQSTSPSSIFSTSGWGGVFSTFSSIKSGLYDVIDPRLKPEEELELSTEEAPKSPFKVLLDRIQPTPNSPTSLIDRLDKTIDYATDQLGQVLVGGIRSIGWESTVRSDISFDDNPNIASVTSTEPLNSNKTSSVVGSISKNIYNTGISTLGLISRKTAGIVGSLNLTKIDRKTLKMPLSEHLEETGVMRAIEQLQLMSTQTSINLKCRMRELPPQELCRVQEILKNDQKLKLSFLSNPIEPLVLAECDSTPWESISLLPNMEAARIQRVLRTLKANLQLPSIEITMKEIDDLRAAVDSPLPPDQTSLILFLGRRRLATILGASCELFSIINCADLAALSHIISVIAGSLVTTMYYSKASETRQETLLLAIKADVDQAMGILSDASGTLEPACRLIIFENI